MGIITNIIRINISTNLVPTEIFDITIIINSSIVHIHHAPAH